jgi:hypothetical protein
LLPGVVVVPKPDTTAKVACNKANPPCCQATATACCAEAKKGSEAACICDLCPICSSEGVCCGLCPVCAADDCCASGETCCADAQK